MPRRKEPTTDEEPQPLNAAMRRHLVSAYITVNHLLRQMEEGAAEGRSPTGVGSPLTPLEAARAEPVLAPLREVRARLRELAAELAPRELAAFEQPQTPNNTLVWMSNLLDRIRGAVDGLAPGRMRKYGGLTDEQRARQQAMHEELSALVASAREALGEGDWSEGD